MEQPRIGVYICHCGVNIAGTVNVREVVEYAKNLPNVVEAKDYVFMCSAPGQEIIREDIKKCQLNRVVVAACSPTMHEHTFRTVLAEAGLNPYLLEMANIREHCSWVHTDKVAATEKAKKLVEIAVAKASTLEPLEEIEFKVNENLLIVGGGVAGMTAALDSARRGFRVYLVEKKPILGGNTARLGRLAGTDMRGVDVAGSMIEYVKRNGMITTLTNTELVSVDGSVGNFKVTLLKKPTYVNEKCTKCGECVKVCPVEVPNEYEFGLTKRKAIYLPSPASYASTYVIDGENCTKCGECVKICPVNAINLEEESERIEIYVGAVIAACGYDPYEPSVGEYGYGLSNKVITLFQLNRLLDPEGPTNGELKIDGFVPRSIAFIMCVGSLNTTPNSYPYCSRMCCSSTLKDILLLKEKHPNIDVYVIYKDMRTYGRDEQLYLTACEKFVKFARFREAPKVSVTGESLEVTFFEETLGEEISIPVDLVVLAVGMKPPKDVEKIRTILKVGCGPEGFLKEAHLKLRPVEAVTDGVYLAGAVTGPKNVVESITSGSAAASKAVGLLCREKVRIEPTIASIREELCSGCGICVSVCPYGAIIIQIKENTRSAKVEPALCKGCGVCAASCPSGAAQQLKYKDIQLKAQILAATYKR
ncbi:MAG: CoB--CoM heterodisulfide reductase iron-sulfur subunit A family protein [Nitrososphaerota archaeon]